MKKDYRIYLRDILTRIDMIEDFTHEGQERFMNSPLIQEATIRCFEVIGEIVKRLPDELLSLQPQIEWHQIAGMHNLLIRDYDKTDLTVVWRSIIVDLPGLRQAVLFLLNHLNAEDQT